MGAISALGAVASLSAPTGFGQGCRNIPGPHKTYYTGHSHKMNANFNFSVKKRRRNAKTRLTPGISRASSAGGKMALVDQRKRQACQPFEFAGRATI